MKMIRKYLFFALSAIFISSCADDDMKGFVPAEESITIVENHLTFPAVGSTETLQVATAAGGTLSAQVDAAWCTASVSGLTVSVTAQPNTDFQGRTALLTITDGQSQRRLPVQQRGMVLGSMPATSREVAREGDTFSYTLRHDMPMEVWTDASWLHATLDGDELTVTADDNSGGHLRRATVYSECVGLRDSLVVTQYDLADDILGTYYLMGYYGGEGGTAVATRFEVLEREGSLVMRWPNEARWADTYVPIRFEAGTATLILPSAQMLYDDGSNYDAAYFYDTNGLLATSSNYGAAARLAWNESGQGNGATLTAANWPGHDIGGFIIRSVRAGGLVNSTVLQIASPVILRIGEE